MKYVVAIMVMLFTSIGYCGDIPALIRTKAKKYNVDAKLVYAIAVVESGLDPDAVGELGEVGLFQLRPQFHTVSGNLKQDVETAVRYLAYVKFHCYHKYGDAWFICYNTGPFRTYVVREPKRFDYYVKVMEAYRKVSI